MSRPCMVLLLDESVPEAVGEVFSARGHSVLSVRLLLAAGAPDTAVAVAAMNEQAIIITWNSTFARMADQPHYHSLGVITFTSDVVRGAREAEEWGDVIETMFERAQKRRERLLLLISETQFQAG